MKTEQKLTDIDRKVVEKDQFNRFSLKEGGLTASETCEKNYFFRRSVKIRFLQAQKELRAQI